MNKTPIMTRDIFNILMSNIEGIIHLYYEPEESFIKPEEPPFCYNLHQKREMIFLSNGDRINYSVPKSSLAHLLGINTEPLVTIGLISRNTNSFDALKFLVKNRNRVYDYYEAYLKNTSNTFSLNLEDVISDKISDKLDNFKENVYADINDCVFVCKFDKERSLGTNDKNMDYLILTKSKSDNKYLALLLVKREDNYGNTYYVPESNLVYYSKEEAVSDLKNKIKYQEITLMSGKNINTYYSQEIKKFYVSFEAKKEKLTEILDFWSKELNCIPNVASDFIYSQKAIQNRKDNFQIDEEFSKRLLECINKRKVINNIPDDISGYLKVLANAYNDSLFDKSKHDNEKSYSKLYGENQELSKKLEDARLEIEKLNSDLEVGQTKYQDANLENEKLKSILDEIQAALSNY